MSDKDWTQGRRSVAGDAFWVVLIVLIFFFIQLPFNGYLDRNPHCQRMGLNAYECFDWNTEPENQMKLRESYGN